MKSQLAQQLLKIHKATGSVVEFEYINPSNAFGSGMNYNWLCTHLLQDRSTRGSDKILWSVTNSECSFTIVRDGKLLLSDDS